MTWAMVPSRTCLKTSSLIEEKAFSTGKLIKVLQRFCDCVLVTWTCSHIHCVTATSAL